MRHLTFALLLILLAGCAAKPATQAFKTFADKQNWVLVEDLPYSIGDTGVTIIVPAGFVTDFASIPHPLWWWHSPQDNQIKAAVVHDYLYWVQVCTRKQADNILNIAMQESDVPLAKRNALYVAVRKESGEAWEMNQTERFRGLIHIIPKQKLNFPPDALWADYRKSLIRAGVTDPESRTSADFCSLGNTTNLP